MAKAMTNFTGGHRNRPRPRHESSEASLSAPESEPVSEPEPEPESDDAAGDREAVEPVPVGNIHDVMSWVKRDKERAQRALDVETTDHDPRKGLINRLKEILGK